MTNDNAHNDRDKTANSIEDQIAERGQHASRFLRVLHPAGSVFEIRALGVDGTTQTHAGFFDDPDVAAQNAVRLDILHEPRGIYVTLNPVQPELLSRCKNRLAKAKRGETTADQHVLKRRWLYIDVDPERAGGVSGIPATDDERDAARQRAEDVCAWLTQEFGWQEPIRVESGNGAFLLFPIDLPNDAESTALIKAILAGIAARWTDDRVKIDRSVFNAGRICRLLATKNRKGDSTKQRPHRFCQKLRVPDYLANGWAHPILVEKLQAVAALAPIDASCNQKRARLSENGASAGHVGNGHHRLSVEDWLIDRRVDFQSAKTLADGRTCWPIKCPFNPDHGHDANITQDAGRRLFS